MTNPKTTIIGILTGLGAFLAANQILPAKLQAVAVALVALGLALLGILAKDA